MSDDTKSVTPNEDSTLRSLTAMMREFNAGTMKLAGKDASGRVVWVALIAVDEEAERLSPAIDLLTDEEDAG